MAKIRVLLTDDHTLFRQGIRTLLSAEPDIETVGEAANADDAHRPLDRSHNLAASLSHVETRQVRPDYTLRWEVMGRGMHGIS